MQHQHDHHHHHHIITMITIRVVVDVRSKRSICTRTDVPAENSSVPVNAVMRVCVCVCFLDGHQVGRAAHV